MTQANSELEALSIGRVIEVDGENFIAEFEASKNGLKREHNGTTYEIGQFGTILKLVFQEGRSVYGRISRLRLRAEYEKERGIDPKGDPDALVAEVNGFGEGEWMRAKNAAAGSRGTLRFKRGLHLYPIPGQKIYFASRDELDQLFGDSQKYLVTIGEHTGSSGIKCYADINELLGKHSAILGSTGAGKSCTVAAVLHSLLERGQVMKYAHWSPTVVVLDPHNEYGQAFKDAHRRLSTDEGTLFLPHWLLNLEETITLFLGRTQVPQNSDINIIKRCLWQVREDGAKALGIKPDEITVDSPIPYTLEQFKKSVESWRNTKDSEELRQPYNSLISNVNVVQRDTRMSFLSDSRWDGKNDPVADILSQFVGDGPAVRVVDLSGIPDEVAGLTSGVIARMLFNFKLWQSAHEREADPILLVCEEAHRYVPDRGEAQYAAAQQAVRRIAKEGRKYGIGLLLVSQRPSELEATVLSQCNSLIVMRITNETDLAHVRSILPDSMKELGRRVSELRRQEAIFVGQAALMPSRLIVRGLERDSLPRSTDVDFNQGWQAEYMKKDFIQKIAHHWRCQNRNS